MIATAESTYGPVCAKHGIILPPDRHAEYVIQMKQAISMDPVLQVPVSDETAGSPVPVTVNHGRWIVDCPGVGCGDAQLASRDDARFFCITCGNRFIGGRWLETVWPEDPDAITAALDPRPVAFQNWTTETVDDLLRDNADPVNGA